MAAFADIPMPQLANRLPSILFSSLRTSPHIAPHSGLISIRLIVHQPLTAPDKCSFRLANETRT